MQTNATLTLTFIALTAITSFIAFSNAKVMDDLIFYPPAITKNNQWYRFVTCGFIHADLQHLIFNMFSFYFFGTIVEPAFISLFGNIGAALYSIFYLSALIVSLLPTYFKNRHNTRYSSLGASGAVSAVIFAGICIMPQNGIRLFLIPFDIPGFIFGPLYLVITAVLDKRGHGNINHSAHLWGALYGVVFFIAACFILTNINPITFFVEQITQYFKNF